MEKYKVANEFYNLVLTNPDDFDADSVNNRSNTLYVINHRYRKVQIAILVDHVNSDSTEVLVMADFIDTSIIHASQDIQCKLLEWAKQKIANKGLMKEIAQDNKNLNTLLQFYADKE